MALARKKVESSRKPKTVEQAEALVRHVESLCMPWDVDGMAAGFKEDYVARFGLLPKTHGRAAVREFFRKRSEERKNYRLRRTLCAMMGATSAIDWVGTWEDAQTGAAKRGHGVEIWQLRGGKLAVWEAAFNIGSKDGAHELAIV
jgi:nuclear transport factor 2 (NTF2) superfamily protein